MKTFDFTAVGDIEDVSPIPSGRYVCRVAKVEEWNTKNGDDMWRLWLEVTEGEFQGRLVFDNLVFSELAARRAKHICCAFGFDVTRPIDLTPSSFEGRLARVTVGVRDYVAKDGLTKKGNVVPFAGYEPVNITANGTGNANGNPLPF